jgi:hypothetical protein
MGKSVHGYEVKDMGCAARRRWWLDQMDKPATDGGLGEDHVCR